MQTLWLKGSAVFRGPLIRLDSLNCLLALVPPPATCVCTGLADGIVFNGRGVSAGQEFQT
jgi:hypothetical protein